MNAQMQAIDKAAAGDLIEKTLASGASALDEWQSKNLFMAYGIPIPAGALVKGEAEAVAAAVRIGGRVVMKGMGADFHHKTEAGLVVLGVEAADAEAVAETYRLLEQRGGGGLEAVLVEEMVSSSRELMVGMKRDPVFGPVVAFGLGGVLTEALGDVVLGIAPLDERGAAELPGLIKAKKLLGSFRGYPPVDTAALAKIIQAIGQMALDHPEIAEIDVNPILVSGAQPIAADAFIILSPDGVKEKAESTFVPNFQALLAPRSMVL